MQRNPLMKQPPKFVNEKQNNVFSQFQNKKPREHQKKTIFWVKTKHSLKSFVFCFFGFAWVCFKGFQVLFAFLDVAQDKYGCRHYWLHEKDEANDRVKQTRGEVVRQKVLNKSLPLNNNDEIF